MVENLKQKTNFKYILIVCLVLLTIILAICSNILDDSIEISKRQIATLLLENEELKKNILILQEKLEELSKISLSVSSNISFWSRSNIIRLICLGCVLTTLIGTSVFFAYTPYIINYTGQSWSCSIIPYFYPVVWAKDQVPRIFRDNVENYFRLVFDTSLDTFILDVQLAGTTHAITIGEFLQSILR